MKKPNPKQIIYQRISSSRELKKKQKLFYTKLIKQQNIKYRCALPKDFSLYKETERSQILQTIKRISLASEKEYVYLDFIRVEHLLPDATIHMVHTLKRFAQKPILGRPAKNRIVKAMLSKLGVHKQLNLKDFHLNRNEPLVDKWYHCYGISTDFGENYNEIENKLSEYFSEDNCFVIHNAISEAVSNVVNHAYNETDDYKGWLLFLHINETSVSIIISDLGKTIPKTVPINFKEKFTSYFKLHISQLGTVSDDKLIEYATQYRRTETELSHRGKGFEDMQKICKQVNNSTMFIYSRHGYWHNNGSSQLYNEPINGTIIGWQILLKNDEKNLKQVA